ncbi:MAG: DUF3783 domain-containing protein [Oscillospiraceae bacterium]|nr:DUF3783 domain-containing protein [Oscillospiraceae bacterium]
MSTLLLCNLSAEKRAAVWGVAVQCACRCTAVKPERFGATLAQILANEPGGTPPEQPFTEELLVMSDLSERQMHTLLNLLRQRRIFISLKAMVTPTNAAWTVQALYGELCREREAFARQDKE